MLLPTLTLKLGRTDLGLLRQAAERLWHHATVYDLADVNEHTKPPLATLVASVLLLVPQALQERLWDLFNLVAFLAWGKRYATSRRHLLVGILFTLNAWNAEILMGQFNLLTLWGMIWATEGKSPLRGAGLVLALLFKPANLVFLPWVWRYGRRRGLLLSAAATLAVLAGVYAGVFGPGALFADHLAWWRFLPGSVAKHLLRDDNYGLPSLVAQVAGGINTSTPWMVVGLLLAIWVTRREEKTSALAWLAGIGIVVSPMAWLQNYSLLLAANLVWLSEYRRRQMFQIGVALALVYVFHQGWNPTLKPYLGVFAAFRPPLLAWLVASSLIVSSLRFQRHSDRRFSSD